MLLSGALLADSNMEKNGWSRPFDDQIPLPRGRQLVTLKDAATYVMKQPKAEQNLPEWQAAVEALIVVAELGGPTMFARIGVMRALNLGKPSPVTGPRRKRAKTYRVTK
jgi:hypothetical protein